MYRYLSSIGHSSARALRIGRDSTRSVPTGSSRAARSRAILAAAIAASLLLPFSSGAAPIVSAAPSAPSAGLVRAESPDGLIRMSLTPGASEARYIMSLSFLGQAPKPAACVTRAVTGEIVMNPDGSVVPELSRISLDQRTLKCQSPLSDSRAQNLLQTAQHPMAEFTAKSAPGLSAPLPVGDATFQLVGDQTVRGQTQPTTYDTTANLTADALTGKARATLKMTSFGITPPNLGIAQVMDDMVVEIDMKAGLASPAAGAAVPPAAPARRTQSRPLRRAQPRPKRPDLAARHRRDPHLTLPHAAGALGGGLGVSDPLAFQ
jgi:polyisoprenoid-binding protein YceI